MSYKYKFISNLKQLDQEKMELLDGLLKTQASQCTKAFEVGTYAGYVTLLLGGHIGNITTIDYDQFVSPNVDEHKKLNSMQRNLLKEYINNISNTNSLREFINGEVKKVKEILNKILPRVDDDITKIKLTEAIKQADGIKKGKIVKDKQVVSLMRYYELIKELHNVTS